MNVEQFNAMIVESGQFSPLFGKEPAELKESNVTGRIVEEVLPTGTKIKQFKLLDALTNTYTDLGIGVVFGTDPNKTVVNIGKFIAVRDHVNKTTGVKTFESGKTYRYLAY